MRFILNKVFWIVVLCFFGYLNMMIKLINWDYVFLIELFIYKVNGVRLLDKVEFIFFYKVCEEGNDF